MEPLKLLKAIGSAVHDVPGTGIIIESTANGEGTFKEMWEDESNGYRKIFFSPVVSPEYRIELEQDYDFIMSSSPDSRYGDEVALSETIRRELGVWHPELSDPESQDHEIACRLAWRRHKIDTKFFGNKKAFMEEFPYTAAEAFMTSGSSVFPADILTGLRDYLTDLPVRQFDLAPLAYGNLNGPGLDVEPETMFIPSNEERLLVATHWDDIQPEEKFVIGVDASYGFNTIESNIDKANKAAVSVLKVRADYKQEVALWNWSVPPYVLADIAAALGYLYNNGLIVVEWGSAGSSVLERLERTLHYPNLYWRERWDAPSKTFEKVYGWATSDDSKSIMLSKLEAAIREDRLKLRFVKTINELLGFKKFEKIDAITGKRTIKFGGGTTSRDDIVMALGMAIAGSENIVFPSLSPKKELEQTFGTAAFFEKKLAEKQHRERYHMYRRGVGA